MPGCCASAAPAESTDPIASASAGRTHGHFIERIHSSSNAGCAGTLFDAGSGDTGSSSGGAKAELVNGGQEFRGIAVHPVGARAIELFVPVTTAQQPDAEHGGTARGEQIPDRVADHIAFLGPDLQLLLHGQEEIRL